MAANYARRRRRKVPPSTILSFPRRHGTAAARDVAPHPEERARRETPSRGVILVREEPRPRWAAVTASSAKEVALARDGGNVGGIGLGGILVIVGIVLMIVWSFWVGLIIALVGLVAFGGFAKGKWY